MQLTGSVSCFASAVRSALRDGGAGEGGAVPATAAHSRGGGPWVFGSRVLASMIRQEERGDTLRVARRCAGSRMVRGLLRRAAQGDASRREADALQDYLLAVLDEGNWGGGVGGLVVVC